jgi:hypothetical protein
MEKEGRTMKDKIFIPYKPENMWIFEGLKRIAEEIIERRAAEQENEES